MMDKHARLLKLVRLRQESPWPGYRCIGDYHGGVYECDFVSPYTRSAGNVDAELMILLQDWSCDEALRGPILPERLSLGHDPGRTTNKRLKDLLQRHFGLRAEGRVCDERFSVRQARHDERFDTDARSRARCARVRAPLYLSVANLAARGEVGGGREPVSAWGERARI